MLGYSQSEITVCDSLCVCFIQGSTVGSVQATDRLMKELREIYRSHSFKQGDTSSSSLSCSLLALPATRPTILTTFSQA